MGRVTRETAADRRDACAGTDAGSSVCTLRARTISLCSGGNDQRWQPRRHCRETLDGGRRWLIRAAVALRRNSRARDARRRVADDDHVRRHVVFCTLQLRVAGARGARSTGGSDGPAAVTIRVRDRRQRGAALPADTAADAVDTSTCNWRHRHAGVGAAAAGRLAECRRRRRSRRRNCPQRQWRCREHDLNDGRGRPVSTRRRWLCWRGRRRCQRHSGCDNWHRRQNVHAALPPTVSPPELSEWRVPYITCEGKRAYISGRLTVSA